jgi:hypothetical protein
MQPIGYQESLKPQRAPRLGKAAAMSILLAIGVLAIGPAIFQHIDDSKLTTTIWICAWVSLFGFGLGASLLAVFTSRQKTPAAMVAFWTAISIVIAFVALVLLLWGTY